MKSEVGRLARKEVRAETEAPKKTVAAQRADLAALKRKLAQFEKTLKATVRVASSTKPPQEPVASEEEDGQFRFRAGGMSANRKRLGLSAAGFELRVGATGQSVYRVGRYSFVAHRFACPGVRGVAGGQELQFSSATGASSLAAPGEGSFQLLTSSVG